MIKMKKLLPTLIASVALLFAGCEEGVDKDDGRIESPQRSVGTTFDGDTVAPGTDQHRSDSTRMLEGGTNDQTGPTSKGPERGEEVPAY